MPLFIVQTKARAIKLYECLIDPFFRQALFRHWVAAASEHKHVLSSILKTVIDIGANRGQFSLAARRWAPKARIFAFEPLAEPVARFNRVFNGDQQVILNQVAIGPAKGEATIHVSAAEDSSSLLPVSGLQERLFPGTGEVRSETIRVGRLADFITEQEIISPAMLKLDVQGYELEALRGCVDLLDRFMYVYAECSFVELYRGQALAHEVIAWLKDRDFDLKGIYNLGYDKDGRAVQGDFLFVKT